MNVGEKRLGQLRAIFECIDEDESGTLEMGGFCAKKRKEMIFYVIYLFSYNL